MPKRKVILRVGPDSTVPTVNNTTVTASSITSTGFIINFNSATDDNTLPVDLTYKVYRAPSGTPMTTPQQILANGILVNEGTNVTNLTVSGLQSGTEYQINVVVEDGKKNKTAYNSINVATVGFSPIVVSASVSMFAQADVSTAQAGENSQVGDETWAEALAASASGFDSTWDAPIDFGSQVPTGLTVTNIGGELRVIEADLRDMGLSGNIDIPEWKNLKQCELIALYENSIVSDYPNAIHEIGSSLKHFYLCVPGSSGQSATDISVLFPHDWYRDSRGTFDLPKNKGTEQNNITGTINNDIDNLTGLENYYLLFCDDWTGTVGNNNSPNNINGVENFPDNIWNIDSLVAVVFYDNWNLANQGFTSSFPEDMTNLINLEIMALGGGTGSGWEGVDQAWMTGPHADAPALPSLRAYSMEGNALLSGFPDFSGSPNLVMLGLKQSLFSGPLPEWVIDGTIEDGVDDVAWQHFDSFVADEPADVQYNSGDLTHTPGGLSGPLPDPPGGWNIDHVDNWGMRLNAVTGDIPATFWTNNIRKLDWSYSLIEGLGTQDLTQMTQTENFAWKYCRVGPENIPYINWSNHADLRWVWMQGNYYTFANFLWEPPNGGGDTAFDLWEQESNADGADFRYSPQRAFGDSYTPVSIVDDVIDFSGIFTHPNNVYRWERDSNTVSGETTAVIDTSVHGGGAYRLFVTNPGVSGLTLETLIYTV